jgi:hypothetical protein
VALSAGIYSNQVFPISPIIVNQTTGRFNKFILEFTANTTNNPDQIDQTAEFIGMQYALDSLSTRATTDICGFGLAGLNNGYWQCVTDLSGVEQTYTTTVGTGITPHNFRMEFDGSTMKYYIDSNLVATHTGTINLSQIFINHKGVVGQNTQLIVSGIRAYFEAR